MNTQHSRLLDVIVVATLVLGHATRTACGQSATQQSITAIDASQFADGAHHWRRIRNTDRFIQPRKNHPSYSPDQVTEIVGNILLYQRKNGGWPKDYDMLAILNEGELEQVLETRGRNDTSFDNHATYPQIEYLAHAYLATQDSHLRLSVERGIDFMLDAQYSNGGIPHWFPRINDYHGHITFNDGVMMGVLVVIQDIARAKPHFAWVDMTRRERCADAVRRGVQCILKCQIKVNGTLTGWCQQHDRDTYEAMSARSFELASICPQETTQIVEFLRDVELQTDEIKSAIESAVAWLKKVELTGIRIDRVRAEHVDFERHSSDYDIVVVDDPHAPPIWARHYEIGTNRPIFASRDGIKKYRLVDIDRERRTGSVWYGGWPSRILVENRKGFSK